jgi:hypothetical protein
MNAVRRYRDAAAALGTAMDEAIESIDPVVAESALGRFLVSSMLVDRAIKTLQAGEAACRRPMIPRDLPPHDRDRDGGGRLQLSGEYAARGCARTRSGREVDPK